MRLTLVISHLQAGGAERVMAILANAWVDAGVHVNVVTQLGVPGVAPFYSLREKVGIRALDFAEIGRRAFPKTGKIQQILALRRALIDSAPDIIVSFMDTVNIRTAIATIGTGIPVVVCEHCDPNVRGIGVSWEWLRQRLYPRMAAVVTPTASGMTFFSGDIRARLGRVIANPVVAPDLHHVPTPRSAGNGTVIAVGRLSEVKGHDRLITAFADVAQRHPGWRLVIYGEGPERARLESLVMRLGVGAQVFLPGTTEDVYGALSNADIFAMSSYTEGFPMGLAEAMATGLPCVSFDCPTGPRELIRDGVDGLLVANGDVRALTSAISKLIDDESLRQRLGENAREIQQRFSLDSVLTQWQTLFDEILDRATVKATA